MTDLEEKQLGNQYRQKLLQYGTRTLTDAELLAVLLGEGTEGENALELAQKALEEFQSFPRLWEAGLDQFCATATGLADTHYVRLQTCAEITRRCLRQRLQSHQVLLSNAMLEHQHFLVSALSGQDEEVFAGLFLDHNGQVKAFEKWFVGQTDNRAISPDGALWDNMLGPILQHQAADLIFARYCPDFNGYIKPVDRSINQWLIQTLILLDKRLLDHLVIGDKSYFSLNYS